MQLIVNRDGHRGMPAPAVAVDHTAPVQIADMHRRTGRRSRRGGSCWARRGRGRRVSTAVLLHNDRGPVAVAIGIVVGATAVGVAR